MNSAQSGGIQKQYKLADGGFIECVHRRTQARFIRVSPVKVTNLRVNGGLFVRMAQEISVPVTAVIAETVAVSERI